MINPYKKIKNLESEIESLKAEVKNLSGAPLTIIHPEYKKAIIKVKEIKGRQLYCFKSLLDMPHKRYNSCSRFSTEFNMRIDANTLYTAIENMLNYSNEGNFTKVISIISILKAQVEQLVSVDASYRLASCVYFWEDEDLDDYDYEIGDEKIKLFKEIGFDSFFLQKPMSNFLPQMDLSISGLKASSQKEKELRKLLFKHLRDNPEENTQTI